MIEYWYIVVFDDLYNIKHAFKTDGFPYISQVVAVLKDLEDQYKSSDLEKLKIDFLDEESYKEIKGK